MLLMIDNYDSFTYNVVQYLGELGAEVKVVRNDELTVAEIAALNPERIVVSPGPCTPTEAGISLEAIKYFAGKLPILGVCLGHQALGEVFGATVSHSPVLMHGKTSLVEHEGKSVFAGCRSPLVATRYHSLAIVDDTIDTDVFEVTAQTQDGIVMGIQHRSAPLAGVQFHPESVLTQDGYLMVGNFLAMAGMPEAVEAARGRTPVVSAQA